MTVRMAAVFEEELAHRLRGARRIAVVGVGDELQRSDRLGILAAKEVEARRIRGVRVFLAGTTPESFTAPIRRFRPSAVLLIDAADLGLRPGTLGIIAPDAVSGSRLSTHALPLSVVMGYIEATTSAGTTLVAIQPDLSATSLAPTPEEHSGLARLVGSLERVLRARTTRSRR